MNDCSKASKRFFIPISDGTTFLMEGTSRVILVLNSELRKCIGLLQVRPNSEETHYVTLHGER